MASTPNATLTYAGVKLPVWPGTAAPYVRRLIPLREYMPFDGWDWYNVSDLQHLNLTGPYAQPDTEIGTLRWPARASRWAVGHFVVTSEMLTTIRLAIGDTNSAQTFTMADQVTGHSVSTSLYMLPPRPLLVGHPQTDDGQLWVMTLVDARFFWWRRLLTLDPVPSSWANLFSEIGTALSVTLNHQTIPAAYLKPTYRYQVNAVPAPLVLDSAAEAVGLRFVRALDGTCTLQNWSSARTASDALYTTHTAPIASGQHRGRGRIRGGGLLASADIARSAPHRVAVVFGRMEASAVLTGVYARVRSLSEYTTGAATLPLYAYYGTGTAGMTNVTARFTADAFAVYQGSAITNQSELDDLSERAAHDWYGWQLGNKDVTFAGTIPWQSDAMAEAIRWSYDEDRVDTRVQREAYFDPNVYGAYPGPAGGGDWFPAKVTGVDDSGAEYPPGPLYSWTKIKLVADIGTGVAGWVDDATMSGTHNAYRMPSKDYDAPVLPIIPSGQSVLCRRSPTYPGKFEITPWGGQKRYIDRPLENACLQCESTSGGASHAIALYLVWFKRRLYARELLATYGATGDSQGPLLDPFEDG